MTESEGSCHFRVFGGDLYGETSYEQRTQWGETELRGYLEEERSGGGNSQGPGQDVDTHLVYSRNSKESCVGRAQGESRGPEKVRTWGQL